MSNIRRYVLVDNKDNEQDYEFAYYQDAYDAARKQNMAVVARTYEYSDTELVWTPTGSDTWPDPTMTPEPVHLKGANQHGS